MRLLRSTHPPALVGKPIEKEYSFPGKVKVFALDDCLLMLEPDAVQKVDADNGKTELLLDLKSNHLNSADIMEISGSADNMDVLCFRMAQNGEVELYRLNRASDEEAIEIAQKTQDVKYTEDGRRIIKLVSEGTFFAFDWYVQYYNLHSDKYYVEINKIDEDINDYLGKGAVGLTCIIDFVKETNVLNVGAFRGI